MMNMMMLSKSLVVAIIAAVVFSPMLFSLMQSLLGGVATSGGSNPTMLGMVLHTLVFAAILMVMKRANLLGKCDKCDECDCGMKKVCSRCGKH